MPAPVEATKAPVQEQQTATPPKAEVQAVPAPAGSEVAAAPVPAQAKAPVQATPIPEERKTPIEPEQAPLQAAPAEAEPVIVSPVELVAPAKQEQAEVQTPAAPVKPAPQQLAGGFNILKVSTNVIPVPGGDPVEEQEFGVSTEKGGSAEVEVHVLSIKAGKGPRQSDRVVDQSNSETDLSAALDSDALAKAVALYDTVVCVGLGSRSKPLSTKEIKRLVDSRAVKLCGIIARKPYVSNNAKLYGLPLGQQLDSSRLEKDGAERSLILIGIKNAKGDLADTAVQKKMISELVRGGKISDFPLGNFSEVSSGKELRYIEVKGENLPHKNKPVKSSIIKPGYGAHQDARVGFNRVQSPLPVVRHKRCRASAASRAFPLARRKVLRASHARAETSQMTTPRGCGIFDFPF